MKNRFEVKKIEDKIVELYGIGLYHKKAKNQEKLIISCHLIIEKTKSLGKEEKKHYQKELAFANIELSLVHLDCFHQAKKKSDFEAAAQEIEMAYNYLFEAIVIYNSAAIETLINISLPENFVDLNLTPTQLLKYNHDFQYCLLILAKNINSNIISPKMLSNNQKVALFDTMMKASKVYFISDSELWQELIKATQQIVISLYPYPEIRRSKKVEFDKQYKIIRACHESTKPDHIVLICARLIALSQEFDKESLKRIFQELSEVYVLFARSLHLTQDANIIASMLLMTTYFHQAYEMDKNNIHALYHTIMVLYRSPIEAIKQFAPFLNNAEKQLIKALAIPNPQLLLKKFSSAEKLNLFKLIYSDQSYTLTLTNEERESFDSLSLILFNELSVIYGAEQPIIYARRAKYLDMGSLSITADKKENSFEKSIPIIDLYFKGCTFKSVESLLGLVLFMENSKRTPLVSLILDDLYGLQKLMDSNTKLESLTPPLLNLATHLGLYFSHVVCDGNHTVEQGLQLHLVEAFVAQILKMKAVPPPLLKTLQNLVHPLLSLNNNALREKIVDLQKSLNTFYQPQSLKKTKINLLAMGSDKPPLAKKSAVVKKTSIPASTLEASPLKKINSSLIKKPIDLPKNETPTVNPPDLASSLQQSASLSHEKTQINAASGRLLSDHPFYAEKKPSKNLTRKTKRREIALAEKARQAIPKKPVENAALNDSLPQPGLTPTMEAAPASRPTTIIGHTDLDPCTSAIVKSMEHAVVVGSYPRKILENPNNSILVTDIDIATSDKLPPPECKTITRAGLVFKQHAKKTNLFQCKITKDGQVIRYDIYFSDADAWERDFTINTFAIDASGQIHMFIPGALADLQAGLIRPVKGGLESFKNDPIRLLRYFYLELAGYKGIYDFEKLEPLFEHLLDRDKISPDEIYYRLNRFFMEGTAQKSLQYLWQRRLFPFLFPGIEKVSYEYLMDRMKNIDTLYMEGEGLSPGGIYLPFVIASIDPGQADALGQSEDHLQLMVVAARILDKFECPEYIREQILGPEWDLEQRSNCMHNLFVALTHANKLRQTLNQGHATYAASLTLGVLTPIVRTPLKACNDPVATTAENNTGVLK